MVMLHGESAMGRGFTPYTSTLLIKATQSTRMLKTDPDVTPINQADSNCYRKGNSQTGTASLCGKTRTGSHTHVCRNFTKTPVTGNMTMALQVCTKGGLSGCLKATVWIIREDHSQSLKDN